MRSAMIHFASTTRTRKYQSTNASATQLMGILDRLQIEEAPQAGLLVPKEGLEPSRLAAHAPETCASTNSATSVAGNFE